MSQEPTHKFQEPPNEFEILAHAATRATGSAYDAFMDEQNIPIHRGMGVYDARQLPLAPWPRMGGRGTFIELDGQAGYFGMYVVEVPSGGALNSERHMYEEMFLVIEGHGSTEVWREGSSRKQTFEWQPGSLFSVPINLRHRLVNATASPAVVLVSTSAPSVMELFPTRSFIFDNPYEFLDRYQESGDYFKPRDEFESNPQGRAMLRTNLIPDVATCYVPRDNVFGPGYRWFSFEMGGDRSFHNFVADYASGRYSHCHSHEAGRVLVCLRGKGYSVNWPLRVGKRPWEAGKSDQVNRQDYIPGGMVSAAPGGGDWFHQHFSTAKGGMRIIAIRHPLKLQESDGEERELPDGTLHLGPGRHTVTFPEEDPMIRQIYQEALDKEGAEFTMPEFIYQKGAPAPPSLGFGGAP
ncbi:MAG: cupin domain-containing protein [Chloroflexi bacterium]|nr:cupin domain-containing protein [Chloroflexota bacterium]